MVKSISNLYSRWGGKELGSTINNTAQMKPKLCLTKTLIIIRENIVDSWVPWIDSQLVRLLNE